MIPWFHDRLYDVLVEKAGANDGLMERLQWKNFWLGGGIEYRFVGFLGFGGKFHRTSHKWNVSCYPEDSTPARLDAIDQTNTLIAELRDEWLDDAVGQLEGGG